MDVLKTLKTWVCFKVKGENKIPVNPRNGYLASTTNETHWSDYPTAKAYADKHKIGVGLIITSNVVFIDIDVYDGKFTNFQKQIMELDTYQERSLNGGIHVLGYCKNPAFVGINDRKEKVEIYNHGRFCAMTFDVIKKNQLNRIDINFILEKLNRKRDIDVPPESKRISKIKTDSSVISKITEHHKYSNLWNGDFEDYPSQSEADLALFSYICGYTKNYTQAVRIFRTSELGKREKALREDYVKRMWQKQKSELIEIEINLNKQSNTVDETETRLDQDIANEQEVDEPEPDVKNETPTNDDFELPPGRIRKLIELILAASPRPVKLISTVSAVGWLSGLVGRCFNVSNTGLNQYIIVLAKTGIGKEAVNLGGSILSTMGAEHVMGPDAVSAPALIKSLQLSPSVTTIIGEIGLFLEVMLSPRAPVHMVCLRKLILDLYGKSGEGSVLARMVYSNAANNTKNIPSPAFSFIGEGTPDKFYDVISTNSIADGLIPRCLILEYEGHRPKKQKASYIIGDLESYLSELVEHCKTSASNEYVTHVSFSSEADIISEEFNEECDNIINSTNHEILRAMWTRAWLKAVKFAAVLAVFENFRAPIIKESEITYSINLVKTEINRLKKKFLSGEVVDENLELSQLTALMKIIKYFKKNKYECIKGTAPFSNLHKRKMVPYLYLSRRAIGLICFTRDKRGPSVAIKKALEVLVERGQITQVPQSTLDRLGYSGVAFT